MHPDHAMRVLDIMTPTVHTIPPDLDTAAARHSMRTKNVHHLVVMRDHHVLGVISERDLGGPSGEAIPAGRVIDVMTRSVIVTAPETAVREAAALLRGYSIGCLPVVDGKELVGIVTISDLLDMIAGKRGVTKAAAPRAPRTVRGARPSRRPSRAVRA